jgi:hypothetical protein
MVLNQEVCVPNLSRIIFKSNKARKKLEYEFQRRDFSQCHKVIALNLRPSDAFIILLCCQFHMQHIVHYQINGSFISALYLEEGGNHKI